MAQRKRRGRVAMLKALCIGSVFFSFSLFAFEERPYFYEPFEMHLDLSYSYSWFSKVNGAHPPSIPTFHANVENIVWGVSPTEHFDLQLGIETAQTSKNHFYFRSGAAYLRYGWLSDVAGDPVSLVTGVIFAGATSASLKDISSPYAAAFNAEMNLSLGKEWAPLKQWTHRLWGLTGLGCGSQGSPWLRLRLQYDARIAKDHVLLFGANSYLGFGKEHFVDIQHFNGWGKIQHRSIDIDVGYRYELGIWGYLEIHYARRVFAKFYPEQLNSFVLSYHLPFSAI